jgi:hypothetical protein
MKKLLSLLKKNPFMKNLLRKKRSLKRNYWKTSKKLNLKRSTISSG